MSMVYDIAYLLLLGLAAPWLVFQSLRTGKYRQGWRQKFLGSVVERSSDRPCIWFHAVSVGEVNLLVQMVEQWKVRHPDWDVVVTSTTKTGYELARQRFPDSIVDYCPLDFSWATGRAFRRLRPNLLVLAELELWPNMIGTAQRLGVPVSVINGRLSESSFRGYQKIRRLVSHWLGQVAWIGTQSETYSDRFRKLGAAADGVSCTGSLKFDRAEFDRSNSRTSQLKSLVGLTEESQVWVVGSTQDPEEAMAIRVYQDLIQGWPNLKLVIVPRHAERFQEVIDKVQREPLSSIQRSHLEFPIEGNWQVLVVDTIGELGAWWGTADVAYVGGSMGSRGGQNMIEPSAYGAAVCFGPNTRNFRDVVQLLLSHDAAKVVETERAMYEFLTQCLRNPEQATAMGVRAQDLVRHQQGATERTLQGLESLMPSVAKREVGERAAA